MSFPDQQSLIQEPIPVRLRPSSNLHESLQVPPAPRPLSQETTYTDRTSRRDSLETNPPHLAPGERPQIITATAFNLGPHIPTRSPTPPLLERPAGRKKWMAWFLVSAAAIAITLLIIAIGLLIFFGVKKHASTVYVKSSPLIIAATEALIPSAAPTLGKKGGFIYSHSESVKIVGPGLHILDVATGIRAGGTSLNMDPMVGLPTRTQHPFSVVLVNTDTTMNMISTATVHDTATAIMAGAPAPTTVTMTVTVPPVNPARPSQHEPSSPHTTVAVDLQFTVVESGGAPSAKEKSVRNILFTILLIGGGVIICY